MNIIQEIRVRYQETDQMGIVYHSNYFIWFEIGRTELLRSRGLIYRQLEVEGVYLPVLSCEANFKSPAKYDDLLIITTKVIEVTGAKIIFEYQIINKDNNKILTDGKTTHGFINKQGKLINIKKNKPQLWEKLILKVNS